MSDDSGLCIDALGGEPGVHSARFMGHDTSYEIKNNEILKKLKDVPFDKRGARFVCAVAAILPSGKEIVVRETMEGYINDRIAGENGFGYDPIFYLKEFGKTSAEISDTSKNLISHRGKALRHMRAVLSEEGL
jgi:XTP/dITP diphosphohydrolase